MGMIAAHDPSSATGSHAVSPLLRGINTEVKAVVTLAEVRTVETHEGNVRYVARDADGNEYTTFREQIGARANNFRTVVSGSNGTRNSVASTRTSISTRSNQRDPKLKLPEPLRPTRRRRRGGPLSRRRPGWSASRGKQYRPMSSTTNRSRLRSESPRHRGEAGRCRRRLRPLRRSGWLKRWP
jgi:hypothetical protein